MKREQLPTGGQHLDGVIVTMCEQLTQMVKSRHRPGSAGAALRGLIADEIDAVPGDWRILSISTPRSIYRDLQGGSFQANQNGADGSQTPYLAERQQLGRIGRPELFEGYRETGRRA